MSKSVKYQDIVFMQGSEADEALALLSEYGIEAAFKHLLQWDYGDAGELRDDLPHGSYDRIFEGGDGYIMSWNVGLNYIGLIKRVEQ